MNQTKPKLFYGWVLVAVMLLLLSVGWGTTVYMFSVVAGALYQEFEPTRLVLMICSTGMMLMVGLSSPLLGKLLDRYPNKWIMLCGTLSLGLGFIGISLSADIWMVVASYVLLIGAGMATLSTLTVSTLLARWFVKRRGLAVGIAALGTQFGGFIYPPLFAQAMQAYDWRVAIAGVGGLILLIVPAAIWFLVTDKPEDKGQYPDGASEPAQSQQTSSSEQNAGEPVQLSLGTLFTQRNFLLLVGIVGSAVATNTVLLANLSLFATDLGETAVRGAFIISLVAFLGIFFSPFVGWLSDVVPIKTVTAIVTGSLAISCLLFSMANTYPMLLAAALFMGVGGGGVFPLWASLVGKLYSLKVYGQVMGASTLVIALLTAIGPPFGGWIHDTTGSYRQLFLTLLVILAVMTVLIAWIRVPTAQELEQ